MKPIWHIFSRDGLLCLDQCQQNCSLNENALHLKSVKHSHVKPCSTHDNCTIHLASLRNWIDINWLESMTKLSMHINALNAEYVAVMYFGKHVHLSPLHHSTHSSTFATVECFVAILPSLCFLSWAELRTVKKLTQSLLPSFFRL